jgi:hypothetical protein
LESLAASLRQQSRIEKSFYIQEKKKMKEIKDSGERQEFASGAVRDITGQKPRPDLISPFFMERLGQHLGQGAKKYNAWNWAKGIPNSRCYESLMRHLMQFAKGDTDEDHLAAAACNLMFIIHNEETSKQGRYLAISEGVLADMPVFKSVGGEDAEEMQ